MPGPNTAQNPQQSNEGELSVSLPAVDRGASSTRDEYADARGKIREALLEKAKYPEPIADLFIEALDSAVRGNDPVKRDAAKKIYAGDTKAFLQMFTEFNAEYEKTLAAESKLLENQVKDLTREFAELTRSAKQTQEPANNPQNTESQKEVTSDATPGQSNPGQSNPGPSNPGQETESQQHTKNNPSTAEESPSQDSPTQSKEPQIAIGSTRVEFHVSTGGNSIKTVPRDLRLLEDGSMQMRFRESSGESVWLDAKDHTTGIECTALYCHEGKVFTAAGKEVTSVKWGGSSHDIKHVLNYAEGIKEGELSGIRDGYLKNVQLASGERVVFTKGQPPGLRTEAEQTTPERTSPQSVDGVERGQEQGTPETERTEEQPEVQKQHTQETQTPEQARDPENNPEQRAQEPSPTLPERPTQPTQELPTSRLTFSHTDAYGRSQCSPRDLRLNSDGTLQMRFLDRNNESVWLEPNDRSTGISCACLYHHNGKLYDAKGQQVDHVQWGGTTASSSFLLRYLDTLEEGKVSGVKDGYLNDVRLNGKRMVFTEGLPPGMSEPVEEQQTPASNPSSGYVEGSTRAQETQVIQSQSHGQSYGTQGSCHYSYQGQRANGVYNQNYQREYQPQPNFRQRFRAQFGRWRRR